MTTIAVRISHVSPCGAALVCVVFIRGPSFCCIILMPYCRIRLISFHPLPSATLLYHHHRPHYRCHPLIDCADGADEFATPACVQGYYTCKNSGFLPIHIPTGRLNDGIADCCDGADEVSAVGTAAALGPRCLNASISHFSAEIDRALRYDDAMGIRKELLRAATEAVTELKASPDLLTKEQMDAYEVEVRKGPKSRDPVDIKTFIKRRNEVLDKVNVCR